MVVVLVVVLVLVLVVLMAVVRVVAMAVVVVAIVVVLVAVVRWWWYRWWKCGSWLVVLLDEAGQLPESFQGFSGISLPFPCRSTRITSTLCTDASASNPDTQACVKSTLPSQSSPLPHILIFLQPYK